MAIVKKIAVKTICGTVKRSDLDKNYEVSWVMKLIGRATDTRTVETVHGASTGLVGQFRAVENATGEISDSAVAYVPDIVKDVILGAMGPNKASVEFAVEIGVRLAKDDEKSPTGYIYTFRHLLQPAESDPLEALFGRVRQQLALSYNTEEKTEKTAKDKK